MNVPPHESPDPAAGREESNVQDEPTTDLGRVLDFLVACGELDPGGPAYGVALVAAGRGYSRLTRAQRRLYDRDILPLLLNLPPQSAHREAAAAIDAAPRTPDTDGWRPIREAPQDRRVQLAVLVDGEPQPFAFPCRQGQGAWVNAVTRRPIFVKPSCWRDWRDE
jgi:hypothetical protein